MISLSSYFLCKLWSKKNKKPKTSRRTHHNENRGSGSQGGLYPDNNGRNEEERESRGSRQGSSH